MPGATAEELAVAVVEGGVRLWDVPPGDPRRVEAGVAIVAHFHCARWRRDHPDDPLSRAPVTHPRLQAAVERWVAGEPRPASEESEEPAEILAAFHR
jgi:hypothetical protein